MLSWTLNLTLVKNQHLWLSSSSRTRNTILLSIYYILLIFCWLFFFSPKFRFWRTRSSKKGVCIAPEFFRCGDLDAFPGVSWFLTHLHISLYFAFSFVENNWYDDNQKPYQKTDFGVKVLQLGGTAKWWWVSVLRSCFNAFCQKFWFVAQSPFILLPNFTFFEVTVPPLQWSLFQWSGVIGASRCQGE